MIEAKRFLLNYLENHPYKTAGEIWLAIKSIKVDQPNLYKLLKQAFPEEDQSIREAMALLEENGIVKHQIKFRSILKEWALV